MYFYIITRYIGYGAGDAVDDSWDHGRPDLKSSNKKNVTSTKKVAGKSPIGGKSGSGIVVKSTAISGKTTSATTGGVGQSISNIQQSRPIITSTNTTSSNSTTTNSNTKIGGKQTIVRNSTFVPSKATPVILEQQVVTNTKEDEQEEEVVGDEGNEDQHEQPEGEGEDDEEKKDDDEAEIDDEGLLGTARGKSAVTANLSNNSSTLPTLPLLGMLGIVVTGTSTNDNTILTTTIGGNLDTPVGAPVGLHQQPIDSTTSPPASTVKLKKKKGM